jgi:RNA polymerase sigma-70 factor (ECF subfamily)
MNNRATKYRTLNEALSDLELVEAYKQTLETGYVGVLYQRYQHIVKGVCLKYLKDVSMANDATLELFSNLFSNLLKYEVHEFKSWLLTITRNHCQRVLKEQAKIISISPAVELNMQNQNGMDAEIEELTYYELLLNQLATS